ncbi:hypothetical protein [Methanolapillus africanus]
MVIELEKAKMSGDLKMNFVLNELEKDGMFLVVDADRIRAHYSE